MRLGNESGRGDLRFRLERLQMYEETANHAKAARGAGPVTPGRGLASPIQRSRRANGSLLVMGCEVVGEVPQHMPMHGRFITARAAEFEITVDANLQCFAGHCAPPGHGRATLASEARSSLA
jgi:hypothetical protein